MNVIVGSVRTAPQRRAAGGAPPHTRAFTPSSRAFMPSSNGTSPSISSLPIVIICQARLLITYNHRHLLVFPKTFMMAPSSKHVDFNELTIREYPFCLGDNPNCSRGAPLTIGWDHVTESTRNLELYEYTRAQRRTRKQLSIPVEKRGQMLLKMGYSMQEIAAATLEVEAVKKSRAESTKSSQMMDRTKMVLETTGDLPKGIMNGMVKLMTIKPSLNKAAARTA